MPTRSTDDVTLRRLEMLLTFLEAGSLVRAGEQLGVSAVSVHRALHALQEAVGCQLFRLSGRALVATPAAHVLADSARRALRTIDEGLAAAREAGGYASDRLRIGSMYSLTLRIVPMILVDLKIRRPAVQTELQLGSNDQLLMSVRRGELDAALLALPPEAEASDLLMTRLFDDQLYFAAPADSKWAKRRSIQLSDCAGERFVALSEGFQTLRDFDATFSDASVVPQIVTRVADIFSLTNLVAGGIGCTLLPGRMRGVLGEAVKLIPLQCSGPARLQTIGLVILRARERDPNLLGLAAVCRGVARRLPDH